MATLTIGTAPATTAYNLTDNAVWINEFTGWSPIRQTTEETLGGALVIQYGAMTGGIAQPIDITNVWMTRSNATALHTASSTMNQPLVLTISQGTYNVAWRHENGTPAVELIPIYALSNPGNSDVYAVNIHLITV
jgi:hypothetical protein